jgi:hypothetical protein
MILFDGSKPPILAMHTAASLRWLSQQQQLTLPLPICAPLQHRQYKHFLIIFNENDLELLNIMWQVISWFAFSCKRLECHSGQSKADP